MISHLSMLQRFRARIYTLSVSNEAVILKRARSDADLVLILLELASSLSEEERCVVEDIMCLHNQLWSASPLIGVKTGTSSDFMRGTKMKTLTVDQIIEEYPYTLWVKNGSTKIKIIREADVQKESFFTDLEGRSHVVQVGRCICVGLQGERWTCSVESLKRDRYPITEEDAEGYRQYKMKHPRPVRCIDIPFPFVFQCRGVWRCEDLHGGIITWNGETGGDIDMRIVKRDVFLATYEQV